MNMRMNRWVKILLAAALIAAAILLPDEPQWLRITGIATSFIGGMMIGSWAAERIINNILDKR